MNPRLWAAFCMLVAMQSSGAAARVFEVIHPEIEAGGFEFENLFLPAMLSGPTEGSSDAVLSLNFVLKF